MQEFTNFPMGPKLGAWLGVDQKSMTSFDDSNRPGLKIFFLDHRRRRSCF